MPKPDIHHRVDGERHAGLKQYCHRCTPAPHETALPVVPASRRGDYARPQITTVLADRAALVALAAAGPHPAPTGAPTRCPAIGTPVLFKIGQAAWRAGIVETTGYAGTRAAYVSPRDLARARAAEVPPPVRRHRPPLFWIVGGGA